MQAKAGEKKNNWLLLKEKDGYAKTAAGISGCVTSIRTGRTMTEIKEGKGEKMTKNPFGASGVQLAKLAHTPPAGEDWLYEMKI
jgi:bifunctional non-homologous end joining protein LigD